MNKEYLKITSLFLLLLGMALFAHAQQEDVVPTAIILNLKGPVSPASKDYIHRGLKQAFEKGAEVVILRMDTPGGLDTSMRDIIRDIISSPVPVIVYVAPPGARAASAGTYIMYASHVAAMAPGTNLGAATPVQIGGGGLPGMEPPEAPKPGKEKKDKDKEANGEDDTEDSAADEDDDKAVEPPGADAMKQKMMNDSIAYIRSLAEMRGRNVEWAEKAVREAASLSSEQALSMGVIDVVAENMDELLKKTDGWQVTINGNTRTLDTTNLVTEEIEPDWRNELLSVITNPNVAYILMLLGIYGLFFEFVNPGFVLPGVTGAICLLLALYALQVLPVNYAGLLLMLLGIMFMVAELFAPSFGALGIGGVIAFVIGSVILFDTEGSQMRVAIPLIVTVSGVTAAFFLIAIRMVFTALRKPVVSGSEEMLGSTGVVINDFDEKGRIRIHSETWWATTETPLKQGDKVKVIEMDGLILKVKPVEEEA